MNTTKLLFVEDDVEDRELLCNSLLESGIHDFHILDSGEKAFRYISSLKDEELPHLIVTDLNMPDIDGLQLVHLLKSEERYQKIPVFILTTSPKNTQVENAIRYGAAGYYQKPTSVSDLRLLMHELHHMVS